MDQTIHSLPTPVPQWGWIPRERHAEIVQLLLAANLIEFSNDRKLKLKSGGMTDIYIKVRDARSNPTSISMLTKEYSAPLRWLEPDRFTEIPDAVSCIAGPLAIVTGIPYLTIRDKPKEGRVADANIVGRWEKGEKVVIIDDVITNGASKEEPILICQDKGLKVQAIVVLVDRQQGWRENFKKLNIEVPVWAGMTLHDVRRELISLGAMRRCSPEYEQKNPIIVALDGRPWDEILPIVDQLRTTGCIFKANDLAVNEGVKNLLPELSVYGRVMLDLKAHDIPQTVENICRHLREYSPWAVTVHASGGSEMIKAAKRGLGSAPTKILAITVLTSLEDSAHKHHGNSCPEIFHAKSLAQTKNLAGIAMKGGADGLVCSPKEVLHLHKMFPQATLVTPGVRSPGKDHGDQKRVDTPRYAIEHGATHIVMGRQILTAPNPVDEVSRVLTEIGAFNEKK